MNRMSLRKAWRAAQSGLMAFALVACGAAESDDAVAPGEDGENDAFLDPSGKVDAFGVADGTPEALGILRVVNESDLAALQQMGVSRRSANSIAAKRVGKDKKLGSWDDREIVTLSKFDAIPYVGRKTFDAVFKHAKQAGFIEPWSLRRAKAPRLVTLGDLHGDATAARDALQVAGVLDGGENWIGGDTVVVQLGDILDRGDGEKEILDLFEKLAPQAKAAGGEFIWVLGNHEFMNVYWDFSYVTPGGFSAFTDVPGLDLSDPRLAAVPAKEKPRAAAFLQGGPYARRLAKHNTVAIVGDTLFVHGGVVPAFTDQLEAVNYDARAWLLWDELEFPALLDDDDSVVWTRAYGEAGATDCAQLDQVLQSVGVKRMVVAHTPQLNGITWDCDEKLYRVDTGMSSYYGGPVEVLEIIGPDVWTITAQ